MITYLKYPSPGKQLNPKPNSCQFWRCKSKKDCSDKCMKKFFQIQILLHYGHSLRKRIEDWKLFNLWFFIIQSSVKLSTNYVQSLHLRSDWPGEEKLWEDVSLESSLQLLWGQFLNCLHSVLLCCIIDKNVNLSILSNNSINHLSSNKIDKRCYKSKAYMIQKNKGLLN